MALLRQVLLATLPSCESAVSHLPPPNPKGTHISQGQKAGNSYLRPEINIFIIFLALQVEQSLPLYTI